MKTRTAKKTGTSETPPGDPRVKVVLLESTPMVTFDDPDAPLHKARGAFVRLRPPEAMTAAETRSWVDQARAIARAVRVLPTRRSNPLETLAGTSNRVDVKPAGTLREEIADLVGEADDVDLTDVVESILSEAEHGSR